MRFFGFGSKTKQRRNDDHSLIRDRFCRQCLAANQACVATRQKLDSPLQASGR
jgi:hypothetical protein